MKETSKIVLALAVLSGLAIAWIDSRPNWDDTGITVGMILGAATIFGLFTSRRPWMTALAVCIWVPLFEIFTSHNPGPLMAIFPGFIGAYLGYFIKINVINR